MSRVRYSTQQDARCDKWHAWCTLDTTHHVQHISLVYNGDHAQRRKNVFFWKSKKIVVDMEYRPLATFLSQKKKKRRKKSTSCPIGKCFKHEHLSPAVFTFKTTIILLFTPFFFVSFWPNKPVGRLSGLTPGRHIMWSQINPGVTQFLCWSE